MKGLLLDAIEASAAALRAARRPGAPEIAVRLGDAAPGALPGLLAGRDVVLNDHTPMPTEAMRRCAGSRHVVVLGTGARGYMARRNWPNPASRHTPSRGMVTRRWPSTRARCCSPQPEVWPPWTEAGVRAAGRGPKGYNHRWARRSA